MIPTRTNRLALAGFLGGMLVLLCTALLFVFYNLLPSSSSLQVVADGILLPLRNLSVILALAAGMLALRDLRVRTGAEKGKGLAWAGIALGAGWTLFKYLVGLFFLVGEILS